MGHRVHVDVFDKDEKRIAFVRQGACDSSVRPTTHKTGERWCRYVEIEKCLYTAREINEWCKFMTKCGWPCTFNRNKENIEYSESVYNQKTGKYDDIKYTPECYSINIFRKDYKDSLSFFIANTAIRMISYYYSKGFELLPKAVFSIKTRMSSLEKFCFGNYLILNESYCHAHGIYKYTIEIKNKYVYGVPKLIKNKDFKIGKDCNNSFPIIEKSEEILKALEFIKDENYTMAYKLIKKYQKQLEVEEIEKQKELEKIKF